MGREKTKRRTRRGLKTVIGRWVRPWASSDCQSVFEERVLPERKMVLLPGEVVERVGASISWKERASMG